MSTNNNTIKVELPKLHPAQREIVAHPARFKVLACGRRFGKTTLAIGILCKRALAGERVAFMSLTYKTLMEIWRTLTATLKGVIQASNISEKYIKLITGGEIILWSLIEPDTIRGSGYNFVVIDECAYIPNLLDAWRKVITPLLTDRQGGALFLSSPRGFNDFYELYQMAQTNPDIWASFQRPTWDNPHIPLEEIELQRKQLPQDDFDQEYGASFMARSGLVYQEWSDDNISLEAEYNPDLPVYWGVDDGYVHGDGIGTKSYHPRVVVFAQVDAQGRIIVFDEYVKTLELSETTIANALAKPYNHPATAYIDSSAQELKGRMWAYGIQTVNATHKVEEGIKVVRGYVQNGAGERLLLVHPRCEHLIRDMRNYAYERLPSGELRPAKVNENSADALRYAIHGVRYIYGG